MQGSFSMASNSTHQASSVLLLRINWDYSQEYVHLDLQEPMEKGAKVTTTELWPAEKRNVQYEAICNLWEINAETLRVSLQHEHKNNQHLQEEQVRWGRSYIEVNLADRSARAQWTDESQSGASSVYAKDCVVLNSEEATFFEDLSYEAYLRISRPGHAALREQMLKEKCSCALTGPNVREVLDMAHIYEARVGGQATWENCMLLRADLHRLFDSDLLGFDSEGRVLLKRDIAARYSDLKDKKLDDNVFRLVKRALSQYRRF